MKIASAFVALCGLSFGAGAYAYAQTTSLVVPQCKAHGAVLAVNNDEVLRWESTTANQYLNRGHIEGTIVQLFADHSGHNHFGVQIGATAGDAIEVVYSQAFGRLPALQVGMHVEACGDYITSTAPTSSYPASPDKAILHWVHSSHSPSHDAGFVAIDGTTYGGR
jgi:hypothetical protein